MPRFTHILCPVDFSDISQHALDHAAAIAQRDQARLTVLYVFVNLPSMDVPPLVLSPADRERIRVDLQRMCAKVPPEVHVDLLVREAERVHRTILAEQLELAVDLLVVGTHGRSGFQHLVLGSVTEKVIRTVKCPTLVVPPRAPDASPSAPVRITRILCPIDFSDSSMNAFARARALAEETGARLTAIAVVDIAHELRDSAMLANVDVEAITRVTETETRRRLAELAGKGAKTIDAVVVSGSAPDMVLERAARDGTDLIVMGVHGRGALDLRLFGSTTHKVIRSAPCPVLVVPS
jgi:nucleotide-binding universal stress UspA family protein